MRSFIFTALLLFTSTLFAEPHVIATIGRQMQFVQIQAPDLSSVSSQDQTLAYTLFRSGLPGRDIFFQLNHRHALQIRWLLEEFLTPLLANPANVRLLNAEDVQKVKEYAALFFVHGCQYNPKFLSKYSLLLSETPEMSEALFKKMITDHRQLWPRANQMLRTTEEVASTLFDPNFEPIWFSKDQKTDFMRANHTNFYDSNVTLADVMDPETKKPNEANRVENSRLHKDVNGLLTEQVFSIQRRTQIYPTFTREYGLFHDELRRSVSWLQRAAHLTRSHQQAITLNHYIRFLTTGDMQTFWDANISWIQDHDFTIDFTFGWVERYLDPIGSKGAWQTTVAYVDPEMNKLTEGLAQNKAYFENKMPWPDEYKIDPKDIKAPKFDVHSIINQGGFLQAFTVAGIALPNNLQIREKFGTKSMALQNNSEAKQKAVLTQKYLEEFNIPQEIPLIERWAFEGQRLRVALHEIIGHSSGKNPALKIASDLGTHYSALEENRADLAAIFHARDSKLIDLNLVTVQTGESPDQDLRDLQHYLLFNKLNSGFLALRNTQGTSVNEVHDQGDLMLLNWLRFGPSRLLNIPATGISFQNLAWLKARLKTKGLAESESFGVSIDSLDGKHMMVIHDVEQSVRGVSLLLELLQIVKGTGDRELADALFEVYVNADDILTEFLGPKVVNFDSAHPAREMGGYRKELRERAAEAKAFDDFVFVNPNLELVRDRAGTHLAVRELENLDDFLRQQISYSQMALRTPD